VLWCAASIAFTSLGKVYEITLKLKRQLNEPDRLWY